MMFQRLFGWWKTGFQKSSDHALLNLLRFKYERLKDLLDSNTALADIIADLQKKLEGHENFGLPYVRSQSARAAFHATRMVENLTALSERSFPDLTSALGRIILKLNDQHGKRNNDGAGELILNFTQIGRDMADMVGAKNANLGEVQRCVGSVVPRGFAITAEAFHRFIAANNLADKITEKMTELDTNEAAGVIRISEEITDLILSSPVPRDLSDAIASAYDQMAHAIEPMDTSPHLPRVSMRSSAIGEDGVRSYAGQYTSVLNVTRNGLVQAFKKVTASLYSPEAMSYRHNSGISDNAAVMAVACLEMVDAVASGVVYSRHPFDTSRDVVLISALWGLGPYAVAGVVTPDSYIVGRDKHLTPLETHVSHKAAMLVSPPEGGLKEFPVPPEQQDAPCLSPEQIGLLAEYAVKLEQHFGYPVDIEWALDGRGRIFVLQARLLSVHELDEDEGEQTTPELSEDLVLMKGGSTACPGVGVGQAFHVDGKENLTRFPAGAVMITRSATPELAIVMEKAQGIVTESGSATGHLASIAREFGVPMLVGAREAMKAIPRGAEITLDASKGRIYLGRIEQVAERRRKRARFKMAIPAYQMLKGIADLIVPLHLFDRHAPTFAPDHCRSIQDIVRLVHEMSYKEMFNVGHLVYGNSKRSVKLDEPVGMDLRIIDLGGGIGRIGKGNRATIDRVLSVPFGALLRGLLDRDLLAFLEQPRSMDVRGFLSVMSEQMLTGDGTMGGLGDTTYAIIADRYLNFSSRVGYHFCIIDSFCSENINNNYLTFSFRGGAADDLRKNRRVRAMAAILEKEGLSVEVLGDRIDARFQKDNQQAVEEKLAMLGRLLQFTRQLDMLMSNEESVNAVAHSFLKADYSSRQSATFLP